MSSVIASIIIWQAQVKQSGTKFIYQLELDLAWLSGSSISQYVSVFLLLLLSLQNLLGWQVPVGRAVKISYANMTNSISWSLPKATKRKHLAHMFWYHGHARSRLIIGSHQTRDGLNTCVRKSLSTFGISSCRAVTKPPYFAIEGVIHVELLGLEVGRFEGIRVHRSIRASRKSFEDRIVPPMCESIKLSQHPVFFAHSKVCWVS